MKEPIELIQVLEELRRSAGEEPTLDFERRGYQAVSTRLRDELDSHDCVCFESTGASPLLAKLLSSLAELVTVLPVQVQAKPEPCLHRVRTRDRSIHIPVSDDQVAAINEKAAICDLPWAARIDNRGSLDHEAVLGTIRALLNGRPPSAEPESS